MECGELRVMQNSTTIGVCKSSWEPLMTLSVMDDRGSPTSYNLDGISHHLYRELGGMVPREGVFQIGFTLQRNSI